MRLKANILTRELWSIYNTYFIILLEPELTNGRDKDAYGGVETNNA